MSRPKGSKNKKTLLKEAEALEKIRRENEKNPNQVVEQMERPSIIHDSINGCNSDTTISSNHNWSSDNHDNFINVLHNAVGDSDAIKNEEQVKEVEQKETDTKKKKEKEYLKCERCGSPIYCEARKIDTNVITGMADYHRTSVRYVRLCDKCCRELSGIVDKWLSDPESGGNVKLNKWHGK